MAPLRPKFYYLTPTSEVLPDGPVTLGSIISQPRMVNEPINDYPVPPLSFSEKVYLHNTTDHTVTVNSNSEGHLGIFAQFLQSLGINGNIEGERASNDSEEWTFEQLKTIWFTPSTEYVKKSLEDRDVQDFIYENKSWLTGRTQLYMVTGVKVAYGAASTLSYTRSTGLNLHVGFDFTPLGVPINVGPDVGTQQDTTVAQTQGGADPFVFAFRLRQIKISAAGDVRHKDSTHGALLSLHKGHKDEVKIEVDGLEDFDADASEFQLQSWDAAEEWADEVGCGCAKAG